ncbi:NAD(P)-binding domain-containing protein [Fodinicurvata halophila]|uniref:NAD(P)-binding domain-containing protein n=1 Tax=Fodinicurvata halophila TaxID=1419723 RepID=UPI00362F5E73
MPDDLILVGLNHRSVDGLLREQLFLESEKRSQALRELRGLGVEQALLLSTCDRIEVVVAGQDTAVPDEAVLARIAAWIGVGQEELLPRAYCLRGTDALHHLFAVTAALDSQVLGEPYVLGQVKESHRLSESLGMCGPGLDKPLQAAFRVAKRVRSETSLAERPATLAASALRVARDLYGRLEGCSLLLIGSGEMGEVLASEFRAAGMEKILVAQRRPALARATAERLAGHYLDWTEWEASLETADVVLCANGNGHFLVDRRAGNA